MASKKDCKAPQKREVDLHWVFKYLREGAYSSGLNFTEKRMVRKRAERFCALKDDLYYIGTPTDQQLGKKPRKVLLTHQERWEAVEKCHVDAEGRHILTFVYIFYFRHNKMTSHRIGGDTGKLINVKLLHVNQCLYFLLIK